jgi:hypothetical protein
MELVSCVLLPILALFAATFAMWHSRYEEAATTWIRSLLPYCTLEGFWRVTFVHVAFAGVALAATTPQYIPIQVLRSGVPLLLMFGNLLVGAASQINVFDEPRTAMAEDRRAVVKRMACGVFGVYFLSVLYVLGSVVVGHYE